MGIFSRRANVVHTAPRTEHVVVDSALLARVDRLLTAFERQAKTGGTRDGMDAAVTALARAGARADDPVWATSKRDYMVRLTDKVVDGDDQHVARIWSWLATVAEGAAGRGDLRLAVRCVHFTTWWLLVQTPQMSNAAEMAMRLPGGVPGVPCGRLLTVGLRSIPQLPADELLIDDRPSHENTITMRDALRFCAAVALQRTAHLGPDVAALPEQLLRG